MEPRGLIRAERELKRAPSGENSKADKSASFRYLSTLGTFFLSCRVKVKLFNFE